MRIDEQGLLSKLYQGWKNKKLKGAAKDLLDRAGFVKTDKVEVKAESPLFILPEKDHGKD